MTRLEDISSLFCTTENCIYVNEEEIFMIYWAKYIHTHTEYEKSVMREGYLEFAGEEGKGVKLDIFL